MSTEERRLSPAQVVTLILRVTMEVGIVAALAYWGARTPDSTWASIASVLRHPLSGSGSGEPSTSQAGHFAEQLRLAEELVISLRLRLPCTRR